MDGYNRNRLERWLAEAGHLLAELPGMAAADVERRVYSDNALRESKRREREKLARLAVIERKNAERFAGLTNKGS